MEGMQPSMVASLVRLAAMEKDDWSSALEHILIVDSATLDVARVSYWSVRSDPPSIFCELGYVAGKQQYERGATLGARGSPHYFQATARGGLLVVMDALADERTKELEPYLRPRGVGALLDVPVFARGELAGVLCHEHVGGSRRWTIVEQEFAAAVGQTVATTLEARLRTHAEEAERRATFLAGAQTALGETLDTKKVRELAVARAVPTLGDMCFVRVSGLRDSSIVYAHVAAEGDAILAEIARRVRDSPAAPFVRDAMSLGQSVLIPVPLLNHLEAYGGLDLDLVRSLAISSAMAIPLRLGERLAGACVFAVTKRSYDHEDLRLAESYVRYFSAALHNAFLYEQMQDALRTREEFLSLASHELRTPLTSMRLSVQALARNAGGSVDPETARLAALLTRQVDRLDRLTDRLLAASAMDGHATTLRRERLDLSQLVRSVTEELAGMTGRAGCDVALFAEAPVVVDADPALLVSVTSNLLDNAAKFGAGKPIEVRVEAHDDRAVLVVRDHGIGMSESERADAFRRFERGTPARGRGGLGLGLHVASENVRAHGGSIRVESPSDEGTCFVVELPRAA